jgi:hypothetical protein
MVERTMDKLPFLNPLEKSLPIEKGERVKSLKGTTIEFFLRREQLMATVRHDILSGRLSDGARGDGEVCTILVFGTDGCT